MRKDIPLDEKTAKFYEIPVLVVLGMLGGNAHYADVHAKVFELIANELSEVDHRLMCHTEHGEDYAPEGYEGETWEVWHGKVSTVLSAEFRRRGFVTRKN